jgi:hypothetical protein
VEDQKNRNQDKEPASISSSSSSQIGGHILVVLNSTSVHFSLNPLVVFCGALLDHGRKRMFPSPFHAVEFMALEIIGNCFLAGSQYDETVTLFQVMC